MNPNPKISVVIPAFNCAEFIAFTIHSAFNQTYQPLEVIVIDDGSTDQTANVVKLLQKTYGNLFLISQANGRQGKARNTGIIAAKGELIAFLDGDDIWFENKLLFQIETILQTGADLVFSNGYICLENDMNRRDYTFEVNSDSYEGYRGVTLFHEQNRIPTSSVLVKRDVLIYKSMFPEQLEIQNCEDYYLWTKLLAVGCHFVSTAEPLFLYRVHAGSSTASEASQLFPLLHVLMILPGKHGETLKLHTTKKFKQFLFMIKNNYRNCQNRRLIKKLLPFLLPKVIARLIGLLWDILPWLAYRLTCRLNNWGRNLKKIADPNT